MFPGGDAQGSEEAVKGCQRQKVRAWYTDHEIVCSSAADHKVAKDRR